ncbi:hypothetical protein COOONC_17340 [Cooperia oncophora]
MALRTLAPDGFVLLRDNESCHGEALAFALARSSKSLVVLTIPGRENVLRRRYSYSIATFICLDSTDSIETIFTKISSCTPSCCILDCVDVFVDMFTVDAIVGTETVALNSDLKISSEKFVPLEVTSAAVTVDPTKAMDLEPELSNEIKLWRMADRKVRVGGQIIYTPDKEDDLDDSDPDEDLNL